MIHFLNLVLALVIGFGAGLFFFGGLWWTVRKGVEQNKPAIFLASFAVRMATIVAIIFLFRRDWTALLVLLAGFTVARAIVTRKIAGRVPRI
ncbi:MAG: N-ATPase subunit AtpR [Limisphaerales bacterium]